MVVEEAVLLVPERADRVAQAVDRVGDVDVVLPELARDVLVDGVPLREHQGDRRQVLGERRHPAGAVGLPQQVAGRELAAVERADVVHPQEAALEDVVPQRVLPVDPPGEVQEHLLEDAFQEVVVGDPRPAALDVEHRDRGHGEHRRVDVAEVPLVGRDLPVGVHVPLAQHQEDLILGELRVDVRQGDAVEPQVPGGEPGELPLVGHRDHVAGVQVRPLRGCGPCRRSGGGAGRRRVAFQPVVDDVVEELLGPEHPREGLARHHPGVRRRAWGQDDVVELVRFLLRWVKRASNPAKGASSGFPSRSEARRSSRVIVSPAPTVRA